ncbi:MAG: WYL domain-containing protein [Myxococcales bacterium]|nr:WYL domain-containing protein [Myxococcales bacterium]
MGAERGPTRTIQRVGAEAIRLLGSQESATRTQVAGVAKVSKQTAKRALNWLRDVGAPLRYIDRFRGWELTDKSFALPLAEPCHEDLEAALTAAGLLRELGLHQAADRARALFHELARRITGSKKSPFRVDALRVTQSSAILRRPEWVLQLLRACRRAVVRISYRSPYGAETVEHIVEPWQLWLHNGRLYLAGYSRTRRARRTFALAHVQRMEPVANATPTKQVPPEIWPEQHGGYGVDEDRPGRALLRFRGPAARATAAIRWHSSQVDRWIAQDEVLERTIAYRSCRELARLLAGLADGLDIVEPDELRMELIGLLDRAAARLKRG